MELALAHNDADRKNGNFPPLSLENMLAEQDPTNPQGIALLSRPPMTAFATLGHGPIRKLYQKPNLFDGDLFTLSGFTVYRSSIPIGTIDGDGPVSVAASRIEIVFTRGARAWSYNGTDFVPIAFPDGAGCRAVAYTSGLFWFVRQGSDRYYWSALMDARTIDPMDYATAESEPDDLLDIKVIGDNLYLMGRGTGEVWILTGDQNLPATRIIQRNLGRGVMDTGCTEEIDNSLQWIGSDGVVWRMADVSQRVSDHSLEEKLRQTGSGQAFQWLWEGHLIFCVQIDQGTWGYDISTGRWLRLSTFGRDNWAAICATQVGPLPLFGDGDSGRIWQFGALDGINNDAEEVAFTRLFTAGAALKAQPQPIANVIVDGNTGATSAEVGQGATPRLEMRYSRDGGRRWTSWRSTSFGARGAYRRRARYAGCGFFDPPGALMQFRMNDPAPLRVSSVRVNESLAGRGSD